MTENKSKAEQFAGMLIDTMNKASLSLMISLGHRTGLFDAMHNLEPSDSHVIAGKTKLNERYVREWLGAMVTSGVVTYEPEANTYQLPDEHAAFLTRQAGPDNFGIFAQLIPVAGQVEDELLKCFKNGGGVPYEKYHHFHEILAEDQSVTASLEEQILPLSPNMREKLENGISVLDIGCGSGRVMIKLATLFQNSRFTGIDFSAEAIGNAKIEAAGRELKNIDFIIKDLTDFHENSPENKFDFITSFDAIHDQKEPINVLKGIYKSLKNDGVYLMVDINGTGHLQQDIENPFATFLYTISCMHCVPVSLAQGGEGLGAMWGEEKAKDYLKKAGFSSIEIKKIQTDFLNNYFIVSK